MPPNVTSAPSLAVFRKRLKTHLFNRSFLQSSTELAQWRHHFEQHSWSFFHLLTGLQLPYPSAWSGSGCCCVVQVRKWLDQVRSRKMDRCSWQRPAGLTEQRRVELQAKIHEWREAHTVGKIPRDYYLYCECMRITYNSDLVAIICW